MEKGVVSPILVIVVLGIILLVSIAIYSPPELANGEVGAGIFGSRCLVRCPPGYSLDFKTCKCIPRTTTTLPGCKCPSGFVQEWNRCISGPCYTLPCGSLAPIIIRPCSTTTTTTTSCPQIICVYDPCPGQHLPDAKGCINCASPCSTTTTVITGTGGKTTTITVTRSATPPERG